MGCIQQNNLKVMFVKQKKMLIFTEMESSDEAMMKKYSNIWAILVVFFITWIHQLYCSNYPTYIIKKKYINYLTTIGNQIYDVWERIGDF